MSVVLVLSVSRWEFESENGSDKVAGATINYITEPRSPKQNSRGASPIKLTAPLEAYGVFDKVPAYYDIEFDVSPGAGGKAKVEYKSAKFLRGLPMDFSAVKTGA